MTMPNDILAEHAALRTQVAALRRLLTTAPPESTSAAFADRLADAIAQLHDRLRAHFALEEDGGYLASVAATRPGLLSTVDKLHRQHGDLLAEAHRLTVALRRPGATATDTAAQVAHLLDHFTTHEVEENDLLQETVVDDLGAGD